MSSLCCRSFEPICGPTGILKLPGEGGKMTTVAHASYRAVKISLTHHVSGELEQAQQQSWWCWALKKVSRKWSPSGHHWEVFSTTYDEKKALPYIISFVPVLFALLFLPVLGVVSANAHDFHPGIAASAHASVHLAVWFGYLAAAAHTILLRLSYHR